MEIVTRAQWVKDGTSTIRLTLTEAMPPELTRIAGMN